MDCPEGCPGTPGEVPTSQTWRVGCPQGHPGMPKEISTSPPEPQSSPTRVVPMMGPKFQGPARGPDTNSELRVDGIVAGKKTSFTVDTGAAFCLLTSYSGPTQDSELTITGVSGVPLRPKINPPLLCQFGKSTLIHSVLIMPQCPMALLGRDLLSKLGVFITVPSSI